MRRRALTIATVVVLLLTLTPAVARADGLTDKIDPVLQQRMQADPTALLPVIVEMQQPTGALTNVDRAQQAMDVLRANGTAAGALTIIDAAAGFAAAPGIDALSLLPDVAYIHYDATVRAGAATDDGTRAAREIPPTPPPAPTLPPASPTLPPSSPTLPPPTPTLGPLPTTTIAPLPTTLTPSPTPQPPAPDPATPAPTGPSSSPTPATAPAASPYTTANATNAPTATPPPAATPASYPAVYPAVIGAPSLWSSGATGRGVAVAVLDSGVAHDADLGDRVIASVNFADQRTTLDPGGHGTHIAGTIAGDGTRSAGQFVGVAPQARIVDVRVLNAMGAGRLSSVIRGIEWVLAHRAAYGIRVINMSFGAIETSSYRTDPLAAAVEIAWKAGLVVVAASGNGGPGPNTTATPGIDPYAITVGATDDAGTVGTGDDSFAPFSAWGSADSNAKPDLVAPGRRIVSIRVPGSVLDTLFPDRVVVATNGASYLRLSGTSMATAVASGSVALLLDANPGLGPDEVKAALVGTARAYGPNGAAPVPDPIADGSGLLTVSAAAASVAGAAGTSTPSPQVTGTVTAAVTSGQVRHAARPANALARSLFPLLARLPLRWKSPTVGGIDWTTLTWDSVVWDSVAWDNFDWDSVAWDSVAWDSVAWDSVAWDSVAWDSVAWDSVAWDSVAWD